LLVRNKFIYFVVFAITKIIIFHRKKVKLQQIMFGLSKKKKEVAVKSTGENEATSEEQKEMGFFDHLEELRKRIIFAVIYLVLGCIVSGVFINQLLDYVLLRPAVTAGLNLQNLKPFGQPFLYFKVILIGGLIIAFPFMLFQLWKFIAPGLYSKEKKWASQITMVTTLCFLTGVVFAYFVMIPVMLKFSASFGTEKIKNIIDVNEYFSFISMMVLASGLIFEMPMISYILSKVGILTPAFLRKYRRHAIIVLLIVAAVLTPTPDPINQLIFATPLFILYEISILVAKMGQKKVD